MAEIIQPGSTVRVSHPSIERGEDDRAAVSAMRVWGSKLIVEIDLGPEPLVDDSFGPWSDRLPVFDLREVA
ncbi:MAG: hypothetical protein OXG79_12615 [Chloroflexi bacterium]|nr:hypothetical protein [Chloroflexota bacterium]